FLLFLMKDTTIGHLSFSETRSIPWTHTNSSLRPYLCLSSFPLPLPHLSSSSRRLSRLSYRPAISRKLKPVILNYLIRRVKTNHIGRQAKNTEQHGTTIRSDIIITETKKLLRRGKNVLLKRFRTRATPKTLK